MNQVRQSPLQGGGRIPDNRGVMSMRTTERIVGYDAKKSGILFSSWWSKERCDRFLLRNDVSSVLSIDSLVWPSVFENAPFLIDSLNDNEKKILSGIPHPDFWIGMNNPWWSDLQQLKARLNCHAELINIPCDLIGITCMHAGAASFPFEETVSPQSADNSWAFLGYDVADDSVSALSNCGYDDKDFEGSERKEWGAMLNDNHLFERYEDASSFRIFSDKRIPEHAPFKVFGLYCVEFAFLPESMTSGK